MTQVWRNCDANVTQMWRKCDANVTQLWRKFNVQRDAQMKTKNQSENRNNFLTAAKKCSWLKLRISRRSQQNLASISYMLVICHILRARVTFSPVVLVSFLRIFWTWDDQLCYSANMEEPDLIPLQSHAASKSATLLVSDATAIWTKKCLTSSDNKILLKVRLFLARYLKNIWP